MRLGATLVHLSDAPPFAIAAWAERLATAGFESLWTPNIVGRGPLVPDPFVTLATAAAVTRDGSPNLEPVGDVLRRYAQAGFDDAVVLIGPNGPDPEEVRALLP